jgi:polysaccharide biosynthesis transport protein
VDAQIGELTGGLEKQRQAIMQRIQNDYQSAARREKLLQDSYEQQMHVVSGESEEMDRYSFLKREVTATRTLYESMLQKMKEASIASALRASNIRVLDKAETPGGPYKPDVPRKVVVGLLTGLCLGIGYAVSRERADRTLQDPGDAPYYLKLPELGVIPTGKLEEALLGRATEVIMNAGEQPVGPGGLELSTWNSKTSLVAESVRAALISIVYSGPGADASRVFVVTSASPKEGKTTICCNLAIAMAEVRSNVLLIDGDMRRPRLHNVFKVDNSLGLSDLLAQREPLSLEMVEAAFRPSGIPGLTLMVSGSSRHRVSTLLYSPRLPELLEILKTRFMSVMIDTPPMVNIADARILGRHSDGVILVVRSSSTTRDAALMAKQRLTEDGTLVTGTILNGWNPNVPGYSHYRNYYSGYVHYYGDGGSEKKRGKKQTV